MYGLMVSFDPIRSTPVVGGRNEGLNFGNVIADSEITGDGDHEGGTGRKLECWNCLGEHLKRNCPKRVKKKE